MAADSDRAVLADAWGHIPQSRDTTAGLGSFTRRRIERIIAPVVAAGCMALGAQAFLAALGPGDELPGWHIPLMVMTFVPLLAMLIACFVGRGVAIFAGAFAVIYVVALLLWPFATAGMPSDPVVEPWIWYLVTVATVSAVLAFRLSLQILWAVMVPLLFGLVRLIQGSFGVEYWIAVGLDVSFALILGGVLLGVGWVFRGVATNVDETRARAVSSYAGAAAADAAEQERVAVAALMHDSVLAALIAAARATSPRERQLAVGMAQEALTRLANTEQEAGEGSDEPRDAAALADAVARGAADLGVEGPVTRSIDPATPVVPGRVARALVLAAMQAIANSIEHVDGVGLHVDVASTHAPGGVRIDVKDTGGGFDLDQVPDDRLGIRASIIARVAAVGGTSEIVTNAHGTTVTLEWKHPIT
ncbi:ATP-binding protein [uncultured Microbacterium sp.]|uniref:ATP-binding protein n=1 Tax=uncultured Microbacterium sp. TaxID=191216 RepID=UPI0035CBE0A4